jgi:hypothetical protein
MMVLFAVAAVAGLITGGLIAYLMIMTRAIEREGGRFGPLPRAGSWP